MLNARINGTNRDDGEHCDPPHVARAEQTVAVAVERLATRSLRIVLLLTLLSALSDTLLTALDGDGVPLVLCGVAIAGLALAGVLYPRRAAALLRPRGRIVLVAGLFVLLSALAPGLPSHYEEMPIACLAAVVSSPAWVAASVGILVLGMIVDPLAAGHSLAWILFGPGQNTLVNEVVVLCATAALVLGAILVLRRSITGAGQSLAAVRHGGPSLTAQLAAATRGVPVRLLALADPAALIEPLTGAERRILALLADGLAPKQAAHRLGVALATVRSQIASAKRKTGARTLEQLIGIYAQANVDDA